ncbi:hypothetical protein DsansV1_C18g0153021 [Dioscorea sansibarensis]
MFLLLEKRVDIVWLDDHQQTYSKICIVLLLVLSFDADLCLIFSGNWLDQ